MKKLQVSLDLLICLWYNVCSVRKGVNKVSRNKEEERIFIMMILMFIITLFFLFVRSFWTDCCRDSPVSNNDQMKKQGKVIISEIRNLEFETKSIDKEPGVSPLFKSPVELKPVDYFVVGVHVPRFYQIKESEQHIESDQESVSYEEIIPDQSVEIIQETVPETAPEIVLETAPEAVPEVVPEPQPEATQADFSHYNPDLDYLYRIVECEVRGSPDASHKEAQILTVHVILNRVYSETFPNTINEVINQPGQFAPVTSGVISSIAVTQYTIESVNEAISCYDRSGGALFFCSKDKDLSHLGEYLFTDSLGSRYYK